MAASKLFLIGLSLAALAGTASAHQTPVLQSQSPGMIAPSPGKTVLVTVYGLNIAPDSGNHPDYTQYWHIFVRAVAPGGAAGPWTHCGGDNGCGLDGFNSSQMTLKIDGSRWAADAGGRFEMRYFTGLTDSDADDPAVDTYGTALSGWSNIVSWPVQIRLFMAPPPPPKPIEIEARALPVIQVAPPPKVHPPITAAARGNATVRGVVPRPPPTTIPIRP